MKPVSITRYHCEICGHGYDTAKEAQTCERRAVSQDRKVKVGDQVLITQGDGAGKTATVESVYIIDREWGHYAWERYWHTVALTAKINDDYGHRTLTFDDYAVQP